MNEYLKERKLWWPVSPKLMASYRDGSHASKTADGTLIWYKNDDFHRNGDKPAVIYWDGTLVWFKNNLRHRDDDMPAFIYADGSLGWWKNGQRHRDGDRPAVIYWNGSLTWYKNGQIHRTTGPAVIHSNNKHEYWINGVNITAKVNAWLKTRDYLHPFTLEQQVEYTLTFS